MSYQNTEITPQQGATNETLIGDLTSYFRYNDERHEWELNTRIDHNVTADNWVNCPLVVQQNFADTNSPISVGQLIYKMNNAHLAERRHSAARNELHENAWKAIEIIGNRLLKEADTHGWCSEFDDIIEEVNNELPGGFALPVRERDYEVDWYETYTVTVHRSATYTARNEDAAVDMAREEDSASTSEIVDAVREGNWESDYNEPDYDANEV